MPNCCINTRPQMTGEHELRDTGKYWPHRPNDCVSLGWHPNCHGAVEAARPIYGNVDGCAFCMPECHTH